MGIAYLLNYFLRWSKEQEIKNFVFQGGSVKGIAYLGALEVLEENGIRVENIKRIGGSSIGAITAALLSVGYDLNDLNKEISQIDFRKFIDIKDQTTSKSAIGVLANYRTIFKEILTELSTVTDNFTRLRKTFIFNYIKNGRDASKMNGIKKSHGIFNLLKYAWKNDGLADGNEILNWLEERIKSKTGIAHTTFGELNQMHKADPKRYKQLYVTGVNLDTKRTEVFSHEDTPEMIISDAVRISMSIPVLFKPHQRYVKTKDLGRVKDNKNRSFYVDGGVLDNYPMFIFDKYPATQTLGFRLEPLWDIIEREKGLLENYQENPPIGSVEKAAIGDYALAKVALIAFAKEDSDFKRQAKNYNDRTIFIQDCDISMLDFELNKELKAKLIKAGKDSSRIYLNQSGSKEQYQSRTVQYVVYGCLATVSLIVALKCG